ncbi:MAG: PucR family transcriptional regulator ligand-binding domain-containing protein [Thermosediminibacteraceae bacterium]|nr:PucR family transcriptional regulator ligand-binding domain-containing protein [Thermosediminibacteraceae bacterium]
MITVRDAMNIGDLKKARIVAGEMGLDRRIRYVTVMEVPDITQWLKGGDFIITSFFALKDDVDAQARLIRDLAAIGSAAIAVKVERYLKEIPDKVKEAANEESFPVIEIPREVTYIDIITPLMHAIFDDQQKTKALEEFMEQIIFGTYRSRETVVEWGKTLGYNLERGVFLPLLLEIEDFSYGDAVQARTFDYIYERTLDILEGLRKPYLVFRKSDSLAAFVQFEDYNRVLPGEERIIKEIKSMLRSFEGPGFTVGVGDAGLGPEGIQEGYVQARNAVRLGRVIGGANRVYRYRDLGPYKVIFERGSGYLPEIVNLTVGPLMKEPELLQTLEAYFECNESQKLTCERLFIHPNTLKYRMNKVKKLTGLDLRYLDDKVRLYLGILAYKMSKL